MSMVEGLGRGGVWGVDGGSEPVGQAQTGIEAETSLLPVPEDGVAALDSGEVGSALAKLVLECAAESRKANRLGRDAAEKAQEAADARRLEELEDAATARFGAGLVSGVADISAGAAALGVVGLEGNAPNFASSSRATRLDAYQKAMSGAGKAGSAALQRMADEQQTEATRQEQIAAREKRNADDARGAVDDAKKLIDRTLDFLREYQNAKAETARAAILRA